MNARFDLATQAQLRDLSGALHDLMVAGDELLIDGKVALVELRGAQVRFVGHAGDIVCTPAALWRAFAGNGEDEQRPTSTEIGRLLAENLALRSQQQSWRRLFDEIRQQARQPDLAPLPVIPFSRLDPFTEDLLDRCADTVSPAEVQALAALLHREAGVIRRWLEERGKVIVREQARVLALVEEKVAPAPAPPRSVESAEEAEGAETVTGPLDEQETEDPGVTRASERQEEQADRLAEAGRESEASQEEQPMHGAAVKRAPGRSKIRTSASPQFVWTPERIGQLREAFFALPDAGENVHAAAREIALRFDWQVAKVEYKIHHLGLPALWRSQKARMERERLASLAKEPVSPDQPFPLLPGQFLWDVVIERIGEEEEAAQENDGKQAALHQMRWNLDYPYGSFPQLPPGTHCLYQKKLYTIRRISTSQVRMREILAPQAAQRAETESQDQAALEKAQAVAVEAATAE